MATCEMCGRTGDIVTAEIERVDLKVCMTCAKHGTIKKRSVGSNPSLHSSRPPIKEVPEFSIVPHYAALIHAARESKKMTQEDFAKFLQEKENLVAKWEQGTLKPNLDTAKKIGKVLNINLIEKEEMSDSSPVRSKKQDEFTLGDFVKIRKRN